VGADIRIRQAQTDDLKAMAGLLKELFAIEDDFTVDTEKQILGLSLLLDHGDTDVWVAEDQKKVIGMVSMQRLVSTAMGEYTGMIEDLVVAERYRGMGVGSSLLETVIAESAKKGYGRLSLGADNRNNRAIEFYRRKGFAASHMGLMYRMA
jgi:ribosomal protein S18 acetylase RimI-like enzyme